MTSVIETSRLLLRKFNRVDCDFVATLLVDPMEKASPFA